MPSPASPLLTRLSGLAGLMLGFLSAPEATLAADPSRPSIPEPPATPPPTLEVDLDPTIPDASSLAEWILADGTQALAELPPAPSRRGTVRVSVSGSLYDYDVTITALREGSTVEPTTTWSCECTNDDLLARLRADIQTAARSLDPPPAPLPPSPKPALGFHGKLGLGLLGGGAAVTIVGLSLTAAGEPGDGRRKGGVPTLVVGVAALTAGMTLVVLDHRRARGRHAHARVGIVPLVGRRAGYLGLAGRF